MAYVKKRRWFYLFNALVVFAGQIWLLYQHDWNILATHTLAMHPWWLILFIWLHLFWGVDNLIAFINNRIEIKEIPDDTEEKDEE